MQRYALILALLALILVSVSAFWTKRTLDLAKEQKETPPAQVIPPTPPPEKAPEVPPVTPPKPSPGYTTGKASRDGTGKFYMGREIAHVMGHQAINWLERDNREAEEAPSRAITELNLAPDAVIADIGAGSGYYTFRLSPLVPKGKVVAVDIQPEMIAFLEKREKELGLNNVDAHLGTVDSVQLPPNSIDAALFVDAYHEFSHPWEMMRSIYTALRPGGRVFLLEYRAEDVSVPIKPLHKMTQAQAKAEMQAAGLQWVKTGDFLPWQHFMVFEKPAP
jgi:ubiquinone/menaquinone biosynthesis C-methylase UbiE